MFDSKWNLWTLISCCLRNSDCSVAMDVFARMQSLLECHNHKVYEHRTCEFSYLESIVAAVCQQSLCCTPQMQVSLFSFRVDMVPAAFESSLGPSHLISSCIQSQGSFLTWRTHLLPWKSGKVLRTPTLAAASEVRVQQVLVALRADFGPLREALFVEWNMNDFLRNTDFLMFTCQK